VAGGSLENVSLDTVEVKGQGRLTLANGNGAIQTNNVAVAGGEWYSRAELKQLNVVSFSPQLARYVDKAPSNGSFDVRGRLDNVNLDAILAQGQAIAQLAGGTVRVDRATLNQGQFSSQVTANGVTIKPFVPEQAGVTDAQFNLVADVMEPTLDRMQAQGDIQFSQGLSLITSPLRSRFAWTGKQLQIQEAIAQGFAANGTVNIDAQRLEVDPLTAIGAIALNINAKNLELASFPLPPNLQSLGLEGQGGFVGTIQGTPQKPMIDGAIQLDNTRVTALAFEPQLTGNIQTRSDRRIVLNLAGESDRLAARLNSNLRPEEALLQVGNTTVNAAINYNASGLEPQKLQLQSKNLPVALLQAIAKDQDAVKQIDFPIASIPMTGRLSSELTADLRNLSATGQIAIEQPTIGTIIGDRLDGKFYYGNNTLMLRAMQWQKNNGRYTVDTTVNFPTDPNGKPAIALSSKIEQGRIEDILLAMQLFEYQDFQNLGKLSLPDYFGKSSVFDNSDDLYQAAPLTNPTLFPPDVISLKLPSNPQILPPKEEATATLNCETLLSQQTNHDSKALFSLGSPELSFTDRLALLSCINTQITEDNEENPLLPAKLADLKGFVNGELHLNYDGKKDLEADFDFRGGYQQTTEFGETVTTGSPLQWGDIEIPFVIAKGVLRDNVLTLRPVKIQFPEGNVSFIGSFGGASQTGQLGINQVPVAFLQKFIDLPEGVGVQGFINASANLAGTPADPSARGDMNMSDTRINGADISSVTGNFTYKDARLDFTVDGQLVAEAAPLNITGSIPYQLPNASVAPESNDLHLTFNLKNEGFALLNILSNGELAWLDGEGNVDLMIMGSIDPATGRPTNLAAEGQMAIAKATIQAKALPDAPITNVHGKIGFDLDNFTIGELTGDFSGGNVSVSGSLPIVNKSPEEALTVQLNALNFSFPNLYRGGVDGKLNITGTALEPSIGGDIKLHDGRIFLTDAAANNTEPKSSTPTQKQFTTNNVKQQASTPAKNVTVDLRSLASFNNLKLTLDRNIQITKEPILNFLATGELNLQGTLVDPKPKGIIRLKRGQVNLFATQFRLDNGQNNTATFTKSLDPELDVTLLTSLVETPQSSFATTNPLSAEIQDNSIFSASKFGTIETIRVTAKVQGRASELNPETGALNPIVELTSSPPRKKNELISLLGGTLLDSFTDDRGGGTLALANLAGSALLNTVQDAIGDALGLSEFRLFPTVITDEKARSSTLGLGAEVGIDLSPSLSFSILQIINSDESTQFGLRYRVNDEVFVRGSTNLNGDSRLTVEYGLKF
jgi:translocation and assembly module TamB